MFGQNQNNNTENVSIIGAGPTGLMLLSALIAEAKNHPEKVINVDVIEKRSLTDFHRRQRIIVYPDETTPGTETRLRLDDFVKSIFDPNDEWHLNKNEELVDANNNVMMNLNKRQTFIRKLLRMPEDTELLIFKNFSIKDFQQALMEHLSDPNAQISNIEITWHNESIVSAIDLSQKTLTISAKNSEKQIPFDVMLVCEGEKRQTTSLINQALPDTPFNFRPFTFQPPRYNAAVRLQIKKLHDINPNYKSYQEFFQDAKSIKNNALQQSVLKTLSELNMSVNDLSEAVTDANTYIFDTPSTQNKRLRIFIGGPIPKHLFDISDPQQKREAIIKWAKIQAIARFKLPAEYWEFDPTGEDNQHQLNAITFETSLTAVDNPIRIFPNHAAIILLGDCAISPFYQTGFSTTLILNQVVIAAKSLMQPNSENRFTHLLKEFNLGKSVVKKNLKNIQDKITTKVSRQKGFFDKDAFFKALEKEDLPLIRRMLTQFIDPNHKSQGLTPLIFAIKRSNVELVKLLLEFGANPEEAVKDELPLTLAFIQGNEEIIQALIASGANTKRAIGQLKNTSMPYKLSLTLDNNNAKPHKQINPEVAVITSEPTFYIDENHDNDALMASFYEHTGKMDTFLALEFPSAHPKLKMLYHALALQQLIDYKREENLSSVQETEQLTHLLSTWKQANDNAQANDAIHYFTNAMLHHLQGHTELFLENIQKAATFNFIPALIELGKYHLSLDQFDLAADYFIQAAERGSVFGLIELASLKSIYPNNQLDMFLIQLYLNQSGSLPSAYYPIFHAHIGANLESIEQHSDNASRHSDLLIRTLASLDIALSNEYSRIMSHEDLKHLSSSVSTIDMLKKLAGEILSAFLVTEKMETIKYLYSVLNNNLTTIEKTSSPKFHQQINNLTIMLKNHLFKHFEKEMLARYDHPATPSNRSTHK